MQRASVIFLLFLVFAASCKIIRVVKKVNSTEVEIHSFQSGEKLVHFIPMAHIGKPEYYANVYRAVDSFKSIGFVIFHEGIKRRPVDPSRAETNYQWLKEHNFIKYYYNSQNKDSIAADTYKRKLRKMTGFYKDSLRYAEMFQEKGIFKNMVDQPRFGELKKDERDFNVDVAMFDIVDEYERRFGIIQLQEIDFGMSLSGTSFLRGSETLPKKQVEETLLGFRDANLATEIQRSPHKKIVVVYGLAHLEGTFDHLQKLDKNWVKRHD